jgi:hypothetical protein
MQKPVIVSNTTRRKHPIALMVVAFSAGMLLASFNANHVDVGEVITALGTVAVTKWLAGGPQA